MIKLHQKVILSYNINHLKSIKIILSLVKTERINAKPTNSLIKQNKVINQSDKNGTHDHHDHHDHHEQPNKNAITNKVRKQNDLVKSHDGGIQTISNHHYTIIIYILKIFIGNLGSLIESDLVNSNKETHENITTSKVEAKVTETRAVDTKEVDTKGADVHKTK